MSAYRCIDICVTDVEVIFIYLFRRNYIILSKSTTIGFNKLTYLGFVADYRYSCAVRARDNIATNVSIVFCDISNTICSVYVII